MITLKWNTPDGMDEAQSGPLGPGQSVDFEFTTGKVLNHAGAGANVTCIAPSNGNTEFDVTLCGQWKIVPSGSSAIWNFGDKNVHPKGVHKGGSIPLEPETTYEGTVAFRAGSPGGGLTIKLYS